MTIEPRPLTPERRAALEAEHANCPTPGCTFRDLISALLHAEAENERLRKALWRIGGGYRHVPIGHKARADEWERIAREALEAKP